MNKKLEIELFRYENLLFGKVLHMDDSLRGTDVLYEGELVEINSAGAPELRKKILFVRGTSEGYDNSIFKHTYSSEKEAIEVAQDIRNGINFINKGAINEVSSSVYRVI
jgi:hypothetical protein